MNDEEACGLCEISDLVIFVTIFVLFIDPEMKDFAVMFKLGKAEFLDVHYLCKFVWITCTLGEIMILESFFFKLKFSEIVYKKSGKIDLNLFTM